MRPQRFRDFAIETYRAAGLQAEPWSDGTRRPVGVKVRFASGAEVWHAVTTQPRDGDRPDEPEQPVEAGAPQPVAVPELPAGRAPIARVEQYLAALFTNAGSTEVARVYTYSGREQTSSTAGVGVEFHSGAKAFAPFVHALSPGRSPGQAFDIPTEV